MIWLCLFKIVECSGRWSITYSWTSSCQYRISSLLPSTTRDSKGNSRSLKRVTLTVAAQSLSTPTFGSGGQRPNFCNYLFLHILARLYFRWSIFWSIFLQVKVIYSAFIPFLNFFQQAGWTAEVSLTFWETLFSDECIFVASWNPAIYIFTTFQCSAGDA